MRNLSHCALLIALISQGPSPAINAAAAARAEVPHQSGKPIEDLSKSERLEIEGMLDGVLAEAAARFKLIDGQSGFDIRTRLVPHGYRIVIEMGSRAIPAHTGSELEDQQHTLSTIVHESLAGEISVDVVEFRYGGRDIFDILPEEVPTFQPRKQNAIR